VKLILVKTDNPLPLLYAVSAVNYDVTTKTVIVNKDVPMRDGPTTIIPDHLCYEYDLETFEAINGLLTTGQERLAAGIEMSNNELQPAVFMPDGEDFGEEQKH
jgi:hypothetical protein